MATLYTVWPIHFCFSETVRLFHTHTHTQCVFCLYFDRKYFVILGFNWIIWKAHKVVAVVVIQPQSTQSQSFNWNVNGVNRYIKIGFVIILIWNTFSRTLFLWNRVQSEYFFFASFIFSVDPINWPN